MYAVLRVDLQAVLAAVILDELIDAGRTVASLGSAVLGQVDFYRHRRIFQRKVDGLVFVVVGI